MNQRLKMAKESFTEEIVAPEGVTVTLDKNVFTVKGEKGEVSRKLFYPKIQNKVEDNKVTLHVPVWTQSEKKILFTYKAHLKNMFKGVSEGVKK